MDLYHPALAFVIAMVAGALIPFIGKLIEKFKIDDVVGAVTVHGGIGLYSVLVAGIFLAGYPNTDGNPSISFWGQAVGALVFIALGFIPTYLVSLALKKAGMLRIPAEVELQGLDLSEVPATPYPEGIPMTAMPTNGAHAAVVMEETK
jgi:ammonia channel protein AmtB